MTQSKPMRQYRQEQNYRQDTIMPISDTILYRIYYRMLHCLPDTTLLVYRQDTTIIDYNYLIQYYIDRILHCLCWMQYHIQDVI